MDKLHKERVKSFAERMVRICNRLLKEVVGSPILKALKKCVVVALEDKA